MDKKKKKTINVFVVTDIEMGWDNVIGVYKTISEALKDMEMTEDELGDSSRIIHEETLTL